ncbi:unnamed protein product [Thelazia callipaeda]|uniref:mRNA (guanine-N(7))-methyltransferase n=1 Tax=Thelazia callipaeda TaxID=103827 RepID=A0A0N5D3S3_THECL|nr:unnamed protein product [Thelazia callipaeda]
MENADDNSETFSKKEKTDKELEDKNEGPSVAGQVANHYNAVPQKGIAERANSRIYYLRNFNNWIKSMLIAEFLEELKNNGCSRATVLDLCCGKGGDLLKWRVGNVAHVVATDIASVSLKQCETRYNGMKNKNNQRRLLFTAEFIVADATKDCLSDYYLDKRIEFDLCSCQFSFHYCFESEKQARRMIQNAVERLKPGGYFIGTLPDAERIMYCIKNSKDGTFMNDVLRLNYGDAEKLKNSRYRPPIFGALIHFSLDTQVNCPEYLVHFPVLEKLLADCGLELVYKKRFPDAFEYYMNARNGQALLERTQALEPYPPNSDTR